MNDEEVMPDFFPNIIDGFTGWNRGGGGSSGGGGGWGGNLCSQGNSMAVHAAENNKEVKLDWLFSS